LCKALEAGMKGEVWNVTNGDVELIFCADSSELADSFVNALKSGPGRVDRVVVTEATGLLADTFEIGPTRPPF
jgi:acylphosphatase